MNRSYRVRRVFARGAPQTSDTPAPRSSKRKRPVSLTRGTAAAGVR